MSATFCRYVIDGDAWVNDVPHQIVMCRRRDVVPGTDRCAAHPAALDHGAEATKS